MTCPKCKGQLTQGEDGPTCLQCGYIDYQLDESLKLVQEGNWKLCKSKRAGMLNRWYGARLLGVRD